MTARTSLLIAIVLLLVEGVSGILVAASLAAAGMAANPTVAGTAIVVGMGAYGIWLAGSGIGLLFGRRLGLPLAIGAIVAGLILLAWVSTLSGPDPIIAFGIAVWAVTLALLLVGRSGRR